MKQMLAAACFAIVFYMIDSTNWLQENLGLEIDPKFSALQHMRGDLYGICAPIEHLRDLNEQIRPILGDLVMTPYFNTYRVNLERECPFWAQQRLCNNNRCAVCECEPDEIPAFW